MTMFSGGFAVQPNTIDFAFVFANLDFMSNPTLYVTQIVTFVIFIIAVIWARRKDTKDVEKVNWMLDINACCVHFLSQCLGRGIFHQRARERGENRQELIGA